MARTVSCEPSLSAIATRSRNSWVAGNGKGASEMRAGARGHAPSWKRLHATGDMTPAEIAEAAGVSVSTMYRLLKMEAPVA